MPENSRSPIVRLPLIPQKLLKAHHVAEKHDNRFRAAARLLQSLWRERYGLPIGTFSGRKCAKRRIGSRLAESAASAGHNFLSPQIANLARMEAAYREPGAAIDCERLFGNMLSSMPLCFNAFGPLRLDLDLASEILRAMIPDIDMNKVLEVRFEHSPARMDKTLTGDRTALDVCLIYERGDGKRGIAGIEVKYTETGQEPAAAIGPRYDELAEASGLFKEPRNALLRLNPLEQLFREHLLLEATLLRGDYAEGYFVVVAPAENHLIQRAASLYASFLAKPGENKVAFINFELEQLFQAYGWAGQEILALDLHERYVDFRAVDEVVRAALKVDEKAWEAKPAKKAKPIALVKKAA